MLKTSTPSLNMVCTASCSSVETDGCFFLSLTPNEAAGLGLGPCCRKRICFNANPPPQVVRNAVPEAEDGSSASHLRLTWGRGSGGRRESGQNPPPTEMFSYSSLSVSSVSLLVSVAFKRIDSNP